MVATRPRVVCSYPMSSEEYEHYRLFLVRRGTRDEVGTGLNPGWYWEQMPYGVDCHGPFSTAVEAVRNTHGVLWSPQPWWSSRTTKNLLLAASIAVSLVGLWLTILAVVRLWQ